MRRSSAPRPAISSSTTTTGTSSESSRELHHILHHHLRQSGEGAGLGRAARALGGMIMGFWPRPVADLGQARPVRTRAKRGKYLIVGPGQQVPKPEATASSSPERTTSSSASVCSSRRGRDRGGDGHLQDLCLRRPRQPRAVTPECKASSEVQPRGMKFWDSLNDIVQQELKRPSDTNCDRGLRELGISRSCKGVGNWTLSPIRPIAIVAST